MSLTNTDSTISDPIASGILAQLSALCVDFAQRYHASASPSFPQWELDALARAGFLKLAVPIRYGGTGWGAEPNTWFPLLRVLSELGRANLVLGRLFEGHVNALQLINAFGTAQQIQAAASDALDRALVFGVWNTEADDGLRFKRCERGTIRLDGAKVFATGAGSIGRAIVNGRLEDDGWQMCIARLDELQTTIDGSSWQPMGMQASDSFRIRFNDALAPASSLLGAPGDYLRQPLFSGGAIRASAVHLGGAQALLDYCVRFLRDSHRANDPYQLARMGELRVWVESGGQWLRSAAEYAERTLRPDVDAVGARAMVARANMTRVAIEDSCVRAIQLVERSVGARGLLRPWPFARIIADLSTYIRQPAPDAVLADVGAFNFED